MFAKFRAESTGSRLGFGNGYNGLYRGYIGVVLGLYRDNGKENGNYCLGFRV